VAADRGTSGGPTAIVAASRRLRVRWPGALPSAGVRLGRPDRGQASGGWAVEQSGSSTSRSTPTPPHRSWQRARGRRARALLE